MLNSKLLSCISKYLLTLMILFSVAIFCGCGLGDSDSSKIPGGTENLIDEPVDPNDGDDEPEILIDDPVEPEEGDDEPEPR